MKVKYIASAALLLTCLSTAPVFGADISVTIDNKPVAFSDVQPVIIEGRTYVPLRGVFENMGYTVGWSDETRTATLDNGEITITAKTDSLRVVKNGVSKAVGGGNLPLIINNRFMLPVRAVSEASGNTVNWIADTRTVSIVTTDSDTVSDYDNPNGNLETSEKEYVQGCYDICNKMKNIAQRTNDKALLRFFSRGYVYDATVNPNNTDYAELKELADKLYNTEPASGMNSIHSYFKDYSDIICKYITLANSCNNNEISVEEFTASLDELRDTKDMLAMDFSVSLYQYFNDKNVFYEAVYDEYVLDMMK